MAIPMVLLLAIVGPMLIRVWTGNRVDPSSELLDLLLLAAAVDALWYTSAAVLISTNRHQRIGVICLIAYTLSLPLTYGLLQQWQLEGAAFSLALVEVTMLVAVLRQSLPAARDQFGPWLRAVLVPPNVGTIRAALRVAGGGWRASG
jgi:O-antigen/teichoic acid export membrane protein